MTYTDILAPVQHTQNGQIAIQVHIYIRGFLPQRNHRNSRDKFQSSKLRRKLLSIKLFPGICEVCFDLVALFINVLNCSSV